MGIFNNIINGLVDILKLAIIAVLCLFAIVVGGYLLANVVGLIPEATGLYRPLSVQTFLTDLPFIGGNMIYVLAIVVLLVLVLIGIIMLEKRGNKNSDDATGNKKTPADAPVQSEAPKSPQ